MGTACFHTDGINQGCSNGLCIGTPDGERSLAKNQRCRNGLERVMGIEPTWPAWKAGTLPLSYTREPARYYRAHLPCQFVCAYPPAMQSLLLTGGRLIDPDSGHDALTDLLIVN